MGVVLDGLPDFQVIPVIFPPSDSHLCAKVERKGDCSGISVISKERSPATEKSFHSASKISPFGRNDNAVRANHTRRDTMAE